MQSTENKSNITFKERKDRFIEEYFEDIIAAGGYFDMNDKIRELCDKAREVIGFDETHSRSDIWVTLLSNAKLRKQDNKPWFAPAEKQYVATIHKTIQVSEDQWDYRPYTMVLSKKTRIEQIYDWMGSSHLVPDTTQITITLLEIAPNRDTDEPDNLPF